MCVLSHHVRWRLHCCILPARWTVCSSTLVVCSAGPHPQALCPPHCQIRLALNRKHGDSTSNTILQNTMCAAVLKNRAKDEDGTGTQRWRKLDFKFLKKKPDGEIDAAHCLTSVGRLLFLLAFLLFLLFLQIQRFVQFL